MSFDLMRKRVVVVDEEDYNYGIRFIVGSSKKYVVVGTYVSYDTFFENVKRDRPDLVVMDLDLNGLNGIEFLRKVKEDFPHIEILVLSLYDRVEVIIDAFSYGAAGYILKNSSDVMNLPTVLDTIVDGGVPLSSRIARAVVDSFRKSVHSPLTSRETEVLKLLAKGFTYSEVGKSLNISKETSKSHLRNIYKKLEVSTRSAAIGKAMAERLI